MFGVVASLYPVHIEVARFEIDLLPPQRYELRRAQSMAKHHENNGRISYPMSPGFARRLHHRVHLIRSQIVSYGIIAALFPGGSRTRRAWRLCRKRTLTGRRLHQRTSCNSRVVYDLFREFSESEHKRSSLFGGLACGHQVPDHFAAVLTLKHANIALLPPDLLMKALQQVRGTNPRDEGARKVGLEVVQRLVEVGEEICDRLGFSRLPLVSKCLSAYAYLDLNIGGVNVTGIG